MIHAKRIEEKMTEYPSIATRQTTVTEAAEFMRQLGIRHLPVVEKGKVVGVVSDRDLRQAQIYADSMHIVVSDVMTPEPYCVPVGTPIVEVASQMAKRKIGCTVVLNLAGAVVGIFTTTDGMRLLAEALKGPPSVASRLLQLEDLVEGRHAYLV
jgi:acetoin utilization protein AcuB